MKKVIKFSKFFVPATIFSVALIALGVVGFFVKGINFGIDFKPGLIEDVAVVPTAIELTYDGSASVSVETSTQKIDLVVTGVGSESTTYSFPYIDFDTVGKMVEVLSSVEGVSAKSMVSDSVKAEGFFGSSAKNTVLGSEAYNLYFQPENPTLVDIETVRNLFADIPGASVKQIGAEKDNTFQIRVGDDGTDSEISKKIQETILTKFESEFGADNVAVIQTDFVASKFSSGLSVKAILMVVCSLALIWLYATIRFKWDFALGAVIAIVHDALIMLTFMIWTQMEFTSITLAALLTIIGYSINDTVVIFDRVRENIKSVKCNSMVELLDLSQTENLGRTLITTLTTMLAVASLYIFASGSIKDFALALLVGMVSGVYSTIFIAGAFVSLTRKNWKPSDEEKKSQVTKIDDLVEE